MELVLAVLLAAAIVAAASGWAGRGDALAREKRLEEEISGMKRTLQAPPPLTVSSDLPPLFPSSEAPEASVPTPPAVEVPAPVELRAPAPPRSARDELTALAERLLEALVKAEERIPAAEPQRGGRTPAQPVPSGLVVSPGAGLDPPLVEAATGVERLVDEAARLRNDLQGIEKATARAHDIVLAALPLAREVARQTEALAPTAATLSGLADRLNLLSLNVTLVASSPGEASERDTPLEETGAEIRTLFEEARDLARSLGTRFRRAADAAHRSQEAFSEAVTTLDGARQRAASASVEGENLAAIGSVLETSLALVRSASDAARVDGEKVGRALQAAESRLAAERAAAEDLLREVSRRAAALESLRGSLGSERRAAEDLLDRLRHIGT